MPDGPHFLGAVELELAFAMTPFADKFIKFHCNQARRPAAADAQQAQYEGTGTARRRTELGPQDELYFYNLTQ